MGEVISMRFDKSRYAVVEFLAKEERVPKSEAIREIFDSGRINIAARLYQEKKASLEKAAGIAGLSVSEFMDELGQRNIESTVSIDDLKESLKHVKQLMK